LNEIDKKDLKIIENEFLFLSRIRFDRMLESLTPKQQDYLHLLPLFFHVNHPMLPGYHDSFTPCGIPNYSPTSLEKKIAKTVSQSFEYQSKAHRYFSIASLFLMGSMGTLGQSLSSDIKRKVD
jgi:adenylate cyclase class 1